MNITEFRDNNPSHRWDRPTNYDAMKCGGCGVEFAGETIAYAPSNWSVCACPKERENRALEANLKAISKVVAERYTPEFCVARANEGHPLLSALPRMTNWGGTVARSMVIYTDTGTVSIQHGKDYERLLLPIDGATPEIVVASCDAAIWAIGHRMEQNLKDGLRKSKSFTGAEQAEGLFDIGHVWRGTPEARLTLYSYGAAPHLLNSDGLDVMLYQTEDGVDVIDIRFGYYAQIGPSMQAPTVENVYATPEVEQMVKTGRLKTNPVASKYSGDCPCGMPAANCEYHR